MSIARWLTNSVGTPQTEEQVRAAEAALECTFPIDYRAFVIAYNGLHLKRPNRLPARAADGSIWWAVNSALYGLDEIVILQDEWAEWLPRSQIIIGYPEGSGGISLCVRGPRRGEVWIKSSECDLKDAWSGMYYCAKSFTAMVDVLQADDPGDDANYIG